MSLTNYLIVALNTIFLLVFVKLFWNLFALICRELSALFLHRKKKQKSLVDLLDANPTMQFMSELHKAMQGLSEDGTDQDEIPEGIGEFGLDITNPIPVNTIFGNTSYLGRLITEDDREISYERRGSGGAKNIKGPVDIYEISADGEKIATLYIHPYNKRNSGKAPKGFKMKC